MFSQAVQGQALLVENQTATALPLQRRIGGRLQIEAAAISSALIQSFNFLDIDPPSQDQDLAKRKRKKKPRKASKAKNTPKPKTARRKKAVPKMELKEESPTPPATADSPSNASVADSDNGSDTYEVVPNNVNKRLVLAHQVDIDMKIDRTVAYEAIAEDGKLLQEFLQSLPGEELENALKVHDEKGQERHAGRELLKELQFNGQIKRETKMLGEAGVDAIPSEMVDFYKLYISTDKRGFAEHISYSLQALMASEEQSAKPGFSFLKWNGSDTFKAVLEEIQTSGMNVSNIIGLLEATFELLPDLEIMPRTPSQVQDYIFGTTLESVLPPNHLLRRSHFHRDIEVFIYVIHVAGENYRKALKALAIAIGLRLGLVAHMNDEESRENANHLGTTYSYMMEKAYHSMVHWSRKYQSLGAQLKKLNQALHSDASLAVAEVWGYFTAVRQLGGFLSILESNVHDRGDITTKEYGPFRKNLAGDIRVNFGIRRPCEEQFTQYEDSDGYSVVGKFTIDGLSFPLAGRTLFAQDAWDRMGQGKNGLFDHITRWDHSARETSERDLVTHADWAGKNRNQLAQYEREYYDEWRALAMERIKKINGLVGPTDQKLVNVLEKGVYPSKSALFWPKEGAAAAAQHDFNRAMGTKGKMAQDIAVDMEIDQPTQDMPKSQEKAEMKTPTEQLKDIRLNTPSSQSVISQDDTMNFPSSGTGYNFKAGEYTRFLDSDFEKEGRSARFNTVFGNPPTHVKHTDGESYEVGGPLPKGLKWVIYGPGNWNATIVEDGPWPTGDETCRPMYDEQGREIPNEHKELFREIYYPDGKYPWDQASGSVQKGEPAQPQVSSTQNQPQQLQNLILDPRGQNQQVLGSVPTNTIGNSPIQSAKATTALDSPHRPAPFIENRPNVHSENSPIHRFKFGDIRNKRTPTTPTSNRKGARPEPLQTTPRGQRFTNFTTPTRSRMANEVKTPIRTPRSGNRTTTTTPITRDRTRSLSPTTDFDISRKEDRDEAWRVFNNWMGGIPEDWTGDQMPEPGKSVFGGDLPDMDLDGNAGF